MEILAFIYVLVVFGIPAWAIWSIVSSYKSLKRGLTEKTSEAEELNVLLQEERERRDNVEKKLFKESEHRGNIEQKLSEGQYQLRDCQSSLRSKEMECSRLEGLVRDKNIEIQDAHSALRTEKGARGVVEGDLRQLEGKLKSETQKKEAYLAQAEVAEDKLARIQKRYAKFEDHVAAARRMKEKVLLLEKEYEGLLTKIDQVNERISARETHLLIMDSGVNDQILWIPTAKVRAETLKDLKSKTKAMIKDQSAFSGTLLDLVTKSQTKSLQAIAVNSLLHAHGLLAWKIKAGLLDRSIDDFWTVSRSISSNLAHVCGFSFSQEFLSMKVRELKIMHEEKQQALFEKEALAQARKEEQEIRKIEEAARIARLREEQAQRKLQEELEKAQHEEHAKQVLHEQLRQAAENAAAEQKAKYDAQLKDLESKMALDSAEATEAIKKLKAELQAAHDASVKAVALASQTKSGYVYIISNEGSFGEEVVKIGMTRREDPQDRIKELSGASVPFPFDVHMMVFSENAPELETALHNHFTERRVNTENLRKEFFRVGLDDVEEAVSQIAPHAVFTKDVHSQDWLRTIQKRNAYLNRTLSAVTVTPT